MGRISAFAQAAANSLANPQQHSCGAAQNQHIGRGHGSLTYMASECSLCFYICASAAPATKFQAESWQFLTMKKPLLRMKEWLRVE